MNKKSIYSRLGLDKSLYSDAPETYDVRDKIRYIRISNEKEASDMYSFLRRFFHHNSTTTIEYMKAYHRGSRTVYLRYNDGLNKVDITSVEVIIANGYTDFICSQDYFEKEYIKRRLIKA